MFRVYVKLDETRRLQRRSLRLREEKGAQGGLSIRQKSKRVTALYLKAPEPP